MKSIHREMGKETFYADGLRFECTGCGVCCKLAGGFVYVSDERIQTLAEYLELSLTEFTDIYLDIHENKYVLKSAGQACIFLENDVCKVYESRPEQCRTFPFWAGNLKSKYRWKLTLLECEGIGRGKLYSQAEIETIIKTQIQTENGPEPGSAARKKPEST